MIKLTKEHTETYIYTGIIDVDGNEIKAGDIVLREYGGKVIIEDFGSRIVGAFTYRPLGAINETSSSLISNLVKDETAKLKVIGTWK